MDGVEGWSGSPYGDGSTLVVWQASPTAVVAVTGFGIDEATLLAAAESVRAATDAEWADLLRASEHHDGAAGRARSACPATTSRGPRSRSYLDADGNLCVAYDESNGSSTESCGGSSEAGSLQVSTERLGSGEIVLYGYTTLGTDGELRLEAEDGSPVGLPRGLRRRGHPLRGRVQRRRPPGRDRGARRRRHRAGSGGGRRRPARARSSFSGQGTPITTG